jgi:hypothetical protein
LEFDLEFAVVAGDELDDGELGKIFKKLVQLDI